MKRFLSYFFITCIVVILLSVTEFAYASPIIDPGYVSINGRSFFVGDEIEINAYLNPDVMNNSLDFIITNELGEIVFQTMRNYPDSDGKIKYIIPVDQRFSPGTYEIRAEGEIMDPFYFVEQLTFTVNETDWEIQEIKNLDFSNSGFFTEISINSEKNHAYLLDESNSKVVVADLSSGEIIQTIDVSKTAVDIGYNPNTGRVYVVSVDVNYELQSQTGKLTIIDDSTYEIINTKNISPYISQEETNQMWDDYLTINPFTNQIYIRDFKNKNVATFNGNNNAFSGTVNFIAHTKSIFVSSNTSTFYVTGWLPQKHFLFEINSLTNEVIDSRKIYDGHGIATINPDIQKIYTFQNSWNELSVLDINGFKESTILLDNGFFKAFPDTDSNFTLITDQAGVVYLIDESGIVQKIRHDDLVYDIDYQADDQRLNVLGRDGTVYVYELTNTTLIESIVPDWIKNNAKWWSEGQIGEADFITGIQYMMKEKIIDIPDLPEQASEKAEEKVPDWIKNNAKWWAEGLIGEDDFVNGIKWLVEHGIIRV